MAFLKPGQQPPTKGKGSKISPKMERFIEEYLADPELNGSRAVLKAGYKTNCPNRIATQLLCHPLISAELDKRRLERRERMELKADYLIAKLVEMIERDGTRDSDVLRAIELAGKSIALWKERQEISGPDGESIKMEQKVKEDVANFTSKLSRLASAGGTGTVVKFPDGSGEG